MAININGQVLRNVPEQVSKNVEDIEDLQDRVADLENGIIGGDLNVGGNLSVVGSTSGTTASYSGAIGAASAAIIGNLTVGGTVTATGDISAPNYNKLQNVVKGSQDEANFYVNDTDLSISDILIGSSTYVKFPYAHFRVSNGKLSVCLTALVDTLNVEAGSGSFTNLNFAVPAWVHDKLTSVTANFLAFERKEFRNSAGSSCGTAQLLLKKASSPGLQLEGIFSLNNATMVGNKAFVRFEYNFLL